MMSSKILSMLICVIFLSQISADTVILEEGEDQEYVVEGEISGTLKIFNELYHDDPYGQPRYVYRDYNTTYNITLRWEWHDEWEFWGFGLDGWHNTTYTEGNGTVWFAQYIINSTTWSNESYMVWEWDSFDVRGTWNNISSTPGIKDPGHMHPNIPKRIRITTLEQNRTEYNTWNWSIWEDWNITQANITEWHDWNITQLNWTEWASWNHTVLVANQTEWHDWNLSVINRTEWFAWNLTMANWTEWRAWNDSQNQIQNQTEWKQWNRTFLANWSLMLAEDYNYSVRQIPHICVDSLHYCNQWMKDEEKNAKNYHKAQEQPDEGVAPSPDNGTTPAQTEEPDEVDQPQHPHPTTNDSSPPDDTSGSTVQIPFVEIPVLALALVVCARIKKRRTG